MVQNEHIVYHSRKNLTQMAVVTLFGIVALPFQLIVAVRQHTVVDTGVWTRMIVFVAATVILLAYGLIRTLFLLAFKPPALVINQEGVLDNVGFLVVTGRIPWSNIAQFEAKGSGRGRAFYITPCDRAAFLKNKSLFARGFILMFRPEAGGGAVKIETRGLTATADAICADNEAPPVRPQRLQSCIRCKGNSLVITAKMGLEQTRAECEQKCSVQCAGGRVTTRLRLRSSSRPMLYNNR